MKRIAAITAAMILFNAMPFSASAVPAGVFCDDFSGTRLNPGKWLIAEKNWGGTVTENGKTADYNGGVLAENVKLSDGKLILTGYGNRYTGDVRGINRDGSRRADGKRCGAAIATKDYFGSGSYEIRAKIAPELGCCSAMWTFEYEEDDSGSIINHEIDIEFPGRDKDDAFSLSHALCTTWRTEADYRTESVDCGAQADGEFHTYRFDWHTGSETETPRVEYYFDGELIHTATEYIPTNAGRFWLGLWFPKNWAGTSDFDTAVFEIDCVKITPFRESGDTPQHETYPESGWAKQTSALPEGWLLWHSYTDYEAKDSRLFLRSPDGVTQEIRGDFIHAMNGSFADTPDKFAFMAMDEEADEWDIFLWEKGKITNLTEHSNCRNEDPKWSPDGKTIVFKWGRWSLTEMKYMYDIALLDPENGQIRQLTFGEQKEGAMPCFSPDGKCIYYAEYLDGIGNAVLSRVFLEPLEDTWYNYRPDFTVNSYYPIAFGDMLYYTAWYSEENHCDRIMQYDGENFTEMPFNSPEYDCSDPCPTGSGMIYSSTKNGGYDLYYYDGTQSVLLPECSSEQNDLGACFFPDVYGDVNKDGVCSTADAVTLQKWLLTVPDAYLSNRNAADLSGDGIINAADLTLLKRTLL